MRLLFYVGMPVMITHKHLDLLSADVIANGTMGSIIGFYPPEHETQFEVVQGNGLRINKFVRLLDFILIKIHNSSKTLVKGFSSGVIGLPPLSARVKLKQIPNLCQSSIIVRQFAVVPAFACTTEKLQGQTCEHGVVATPLDRRKGVPHQTLYIALSRSVCLANVQLTEVITRDYLKKFTPTKTTVDEIQQMQMPPYISERQTRELNEWKCKQNTSHGAM